MHLAPQHESSLSQLLARQTGLTVKLASHGEPTHPNHVYVIPPGRLMTVRSHQIQLVSLQAQRGVRNAIDLLFESLAEAGNACVVLLGTGKDGAAGLKSMKLAGALTLVQHPQQADQGSMPRAAIATGCADAVLAVGEMLRKLSKSPNPAHE